jgi:hypothetical protein
MKSIEWLFEKLWNEPKDKFTWHSILDKAIEMHKQEMEQLPQQEISDNSPKEENKTSFGEISDEDLFNKAEKIYQRHYLSKENSKLMAWVDGAKWYREQLKKK